MCENNKPIEMFNPLQIILMAESPFLVPVLERSPKSELLLDVDGFGVDGDILFKGGAVGAGGLLIGGLGVGIRCLLEGVCGGAGVCLEVEDGARRVYLDGLLLG